MTNKRIHLSPPHMLGEEKKLLIDAFESNYIAPIGQHLNAFESEISEYLKVPYACSLSTGTAALHLALKVLGIKRNDHVLCPSLTFAASANPIKYESAIPVFIDVDFESWTLNPSLLSDAIKKYKPQILITVDLYGQSCNYDEIIELCNSNNVKIIEDAAEALGSEYRSKKLGSFGDIGIISFNGNKIITTSGGGMLVSKNEDYVNKAKFLATQAREKEIHYQHKELGYNYRMSNLLAALGRGQLLNLDYFVERRRKIFSRYYHSISGIEGMEFLKQRKYCKSNNWLTTLTIDETKTGFNRDNLISALEENNIESRPVWKPMHLQPFYKGCSFFSEDNKDISAKLFQNGICLPSGSNLTKEDQSRIIEIIHSLVN